MRPIWSGSISFGIVNIPVKLFPAIRDHGIHFHQISESARKRIRYRKVAEGETKEAPPEDIVRGYEKSKGRYVLVSDEEFEKLAAKKSKSIDILDFVGLEQIDPLYFADAYYIVPDEKAGRSYWLLTHALEDAQRVGIAQFVMRSKEYLAAIRPVRGILCLETMHYDDEIVSPDDLGGDWLKAENVPERELKIALDLIESMSEDFDPKKYKDEYRKRVLDYIEKKAKAKNAVVIDEEWGEPEERSGKVLDLMAALEESLKHKSARRRPRHPSR